MKPDIYFVPLGGGQRVGASCYYLRIGEANIILDAGVGRAEGMEFEPDFHTLLTSPFVQSMNQINQIFVSHAHMDHVGYLLKLMKQSTYASVYMTEATKVLSEFQLYDRMYTDEHNKDEDARLAAKSLLDKITTVSYLQQMDFGSYKVTFFPAGHLPGAMMTLFEAGKRRILYTGDYSVEGSLLTEGCMIPDGFQVDTLIMCGLHAKHPGYIRRPDALSQRAKRVLRRVERDRCFVFCHVPQLSKGIEFLKCLNRWNSAGIPIYLDESVMNMVVKMEMLSVPILNRHNRIMGHTTPGIPHIYLTSKPNGNRCGSYRNMKIDFSLHEDYSGMKNFIRRLNPKQAVVVHCGREYNVFDETIEQEMMRDGDCRTQFLFAEEKEIYQL